MEPNITASLGEELAYISRRAYHRGLVAGTGGNISVRVPGTDRILITPTGVSLADITPEINILMKIDGTIIENPPRQKPSKETAFHLSVYQLRPDAGAVAHVHPPYATAFSNKSRPLPLSTISGRIGLAAVPVIACGIPGSEELCNLVKDGLRENPGLKALLMKEHGIITVGPDLKSVYYLADLVEDTAKIAFIESLIP